MASRRWVVLAVASLLSTFLVGVQGAAPAAAAPLSQTSILTNNIQGASTGSDTKWRTMIAGFIRHNAPIVLIQEAGPSGPPGATEFPPINTDGNTVRNFVWQPRRDTTAEVYFVQTDDNGGTAVGGRVNIAIVTRSTPDEVRVVANPVNAGRVALGVRFGSRCRRRTGREC